MAVQVTFPGVYISEDASLALSISGRSTAIPVFVGRFSAKEGVNSDKCVRVENWMNFLEKFYSNNLLIRLSSPDEVSVKSKSKSKSKSKLSAGDEREDEGEEQVQVFPIYNLEGIECARGSFSVRHYFENGGGECYVLNLRDDKPELLATAIEEYPDISLLVYCEYLTPEIDSAVYSALSQLLSNNQGYFLISDSPNGAAPAGLEDHPYVAAYYPAFRTFYKPAEVEIAPEQILLTGYKNGIYTLAQLIEGIKPPVENQPADPDSETASATHAMIINGMGNFSYEYLPIYLRASPAMAGLYALTDRTRGVWKAPANIAVAGVKSLVEISGTAATATPPNMTLSKLTDVHAAGVNAIRSFTSKGIMVWGARTLKGTAQNSDKNWIYVPVRRLFNSVERDVKAALGKAMFEPNHSATWETVRAAIDNYLYALWQEGALQGKKPEEAYFVQVGLGVTMTAQDLEEGNLIVEIGLAAVRPVEFVVLRFTQNIEQAGSKALAEVGDYV